VGNLNDGAGSTDSEETQRGRQNARTRQGSCRAGRGKAGQKADNKKNLSTSPTENKGEFAD